MNTSSALLSKEGCRDSGGWLPITSLCVKSPAMLLSSVMTLRFEHPTDVQFTCTRCGDCCRSMNVMLGPGEEQRLRAIDWRGREADLENLTTTVITPLPGGRQVHRLARREDGSCVYLGADRLCHIQRHFGGDAKPLMCRLYPFGFSPIAGRVAVDCSFSCRSISEGSGAGLSSRESEWTALGEASAATGRRHRLSQQRTLTAEVLWEFEHYLLGFFADQSLPLFDRVRCCLQFMRLAATGDPATSSAAQLREAIARGLPRQIARIPRGGGMDRTQRVIFYQWLFLALNPPTVNADLLSGTARRQEEQWRIAAAQRFASQQGEPRIDNRALGVTWQQIAAVDATLAAAPTSPLLERYLAAKIIGQRFLFAGDEELPLVEAVPVFLLSYPMAVWTSRALAAERGSGVVADVDLRRAIALLDRTLGQTLLSALPAKLARTWHFVVEETDLVVEATNEWLGVEIPS